MVFLSLVRPVDWAQHTMMTITQGGRLLDRVRLHVAYLWAFLKLHRILERKRSVPKVVLSHGAHLLAKGHVPRGMLGSW